MNISYKFSPNGSRLDYALTIDGAEIGRVYDKERAEEIENAGLVIEKLQKKVAVLMRENDELKATLHHLQAK